jgi:hypothetical protein
MPLEEGTCIQDSKEIMIPQDSKVATKESKEVVVVTTGLNKMVHHSKIMVLQGEEGCQ